MTVTINGSSGITAPEVILDNTTADGGQVVLKSSGYSNWNLDNYSGRLRAYYGSTEYFTIDSSGNVGIGGTPSAWSVFKALQLGSTMALGGVNNTSANMFANTYYDGAYKYIGTGGAYRYEQNVATGYHAWHTAGSGTAGNTITFTERMRIDSSGNVGIGTSSPNSKFQVNSGTNLGGLLIGFNGGSDNFYDANTHYWRSGNGTERARIDSSGNLLVGTTSSNGKVTISCNGGSTAAIAMQDTNTSGKTWLFGPGVGTGAVTDLGFYNYTNSNTVGRATSAGAWYQGNNSPSWSIPSDIRVKQNIRPVNEALAKIASLRPCHFEYKTNPDAIKTGFIAQEFEQILPGHVHEETPFGEYAEFFQEGEKLKSIDADLTPYLVAAIQELASTSVEQQTLIQDQLALINAQQAALTSLTARIEALENK